jgi:UDP-2,3-diacylglucosamine pyrophosphatase LpxH
MTMAPGGEKRIFISDIHLGDDRSFAPPQPYGWIRSNISNLANFLDEQLKAVEAGEVAEVVILGDLFDTWVIPTNMTPLNAFDAICSNSNNLPVIEALRKLAAMGILSYVPGNHDMAFSIARLNQVKQFMESRFPGIKYICDADLPNGVYQRGKLVAEHGNRYCLFNAPNIWTEAPSFLPIGYFMSRLVAYKVSTTGTDEDHFIILKKLIELLIKRPNFVKDLFEAIAENAGLSFDANIDMEGLTNFPNPIKVGNVSSLYGQLTENWEKDERNKISWEKAAYDDAGDLSTVANDIYFFPSDSTTNIVIFGHTHKFDLVRFIKGPPPVNPDEPVPISSLAVYANCGAWVDKVPRNYVTSTYVETEEDKNAGKHYVRIFKYPSKELLREDFVEL